MPGRAQWPRQADLGVIEARICKDGRIEDKYEWTRQIAGKGGSGIVQVVRGRPPKQNRNFAIKTLNKSYCNEKEFCIFLKLDHPHIARLEEVFVNRSSVQLVMEYLDGGELFQRVFEHGKFSEKDACNDSRQMLEAVNYLHTRGMVHGDIKPENFCYETKDYKHLKLIDFGTAFEQSAPSSDGLRGTTERYLAPEMFHTHMPSAKADIFALGITVFILVTGHPPFVNSVSGVDWPSYPAFQARSTEAQIFVQSLMCDNPDDRPSAATALMNRWLSPGWPIPGLRGPAAKAPPLSKDVLTNLMGFVAASNFRRLCLNMVAWSLTSEDRQKLRARFEDLDVNKDGRISMLELSNALQDFRGSLDVDSSAFQGLAEHLNSERELSYTEFLSAVVQGRVLLHREALQGAWDKLDLDNRGVITMASLQKAFPAFDKDHLCEMMSEVGKTSDEEITKEEFIMYVTKPGRLDICGSVARSIDEERRFMRTTWGPTPSTNAAERGKPAQSY